MTAVGGTSMVSYWDIDPSNVWTPNSVFTNFLSEGSTILAAPASGHTRVVNYITLSTAISNATNFVFFQWFEGSSNVILGGFSNMASGAIITMSRDGLFSKVNALL